MVVGIRVSWGGCGVGNGIIGALFVIGVSLGWLWGGAWGLWGDCGHGAVFGLFVGSGTGFTGWLWGQGWGQRAAFRYGAVLGVTVGC